MSMALLQIIIDGFIAVLLVATIVFAARLSLHLKVFRDSRKEIETQITALSSHIQRAESAIEGLRENARESGRDLQATIKEASALADELQLMTESGDRLADRLDKVMDKGRAAAPRPEEFTDYQHQRQDIRERRDEEAAGSGKMFAIRDPEFEHGDPDRDESGYADEVGLLNGEHEEESEAGLHSRAEQELYEALKSARTKSKTEAGGVS